MYSVANPRALLRDRRRSGSLRVGRTVVLLGACSLLTDISSEMVATILPVYLVYTLGYTPLQYGVIDGLYQGASAIMRLFSGFAGDRMRSHKWVAASGYALSAICKPLMILAGSGLGLIGAVITADRAGKGIRTAPRDAMISLSAPAGRLGTAFGVHRAMDSVGAMLGPLVAFGLLAAAPSDFNTIFLVSFLIALLGVGVIALLVDEPNPKPATPENAPEPKPDIKAAFALLAKPQFRALTLTASLLGVATISDAFFYLLLRERIDFDPKVFPLLATGTATAYMVLAIPAGRLADRFGRTRMFLMGYGLLLAAYLVLLDPTLTTTGVIVVLLLLGAYYAASDGVLAALTSAHVPEELRGSGLAFVGTATSATRLVASLVFGGLWTVWGIDAAISAFAIVLVAAMGVAAWGLRAARV
jgi:MFS family permease